MTHKHSILIQHIQGKDKGSHTGCRARRWCRQSACSDINRTQR